MASGVAQQLAINFTRRLIWNSRCNSNHAHFGFVNIVDSHDALADMRPKRVLEGNILDVLQLI